LVQAQPATNDLFANRIVVTGTNTFVTGNNVTATSESGEPNHAGVSGAASVWWSWTAPFSGMATITTVGSTFDTVLGVYQGAAVAGLAEIASNDDDDDQLDPTSKVVFFAKAGQTYEIAVDGYLDARGNIRLDFQRKGRALQFLGLLVCSVQGRDTGPRRVAGRIWRRRPGDHRSDHWGRAGRHDCFPEHQCPGPELPDHRIG
jgi:hypothetical protein